MLQSQEVPEDEICWRVQGSGSPTGTKSNNVIPNGYMRILSFFFFFNGTGV
jgi:hypothetical protein